MAKIVKEVKQVFGFLGEDQDYSKKQLTLTSWVFTHQNLTFVHGAKIMKKQVKV